MLRQLVFPFYSWVIFLFLFIAFNSFGQVEIVLKPGSDEGKDAYISSLAPNNLYGDIETLNPYAWTQNGAKNISRVFIDFNFPCLPTGAIILEAKLKLFYYPYYPFPHIAKHSGNTQLVVKRVIQPWSEHNINWINQPSSASLNLVISESVISDTSSLEIDLKSLLTDYYNDWNNSHGFVISLLTETPYSNVMISSSDVRDCHRLPEFYIKYSDPE